jgi:polysaccharide export outer membrane protein
MKRLRFAPASVVLSLMSFLLGCAAPQRPFVWIGDLPPTSGGDVDGAIRPRDTIAVVVLDQPALSGEFVVHDDGAYFQPTLGNVVVQGRGVADVAAELRDRLKDLIVNARVTVSLVRVAPIRVSVVGEVKTPGQYELNRDRSVAGALALAGWLTDFAAKDRIFVARPGGNQEIRIRFLVRDVTAPESRSARFRLRDGDVVVVE